jgi:hypothetical protein
VGSSSGTARVVSLDLGSLLKAVVVGEGNGTSIDPAFGVPSAFERITALGSQSDTLNALDLNVGTVQTATTGAQDQKTTNVVNLDEATVALPGVLGGTIDPATLSSIVNSTGAASALNSSIADLNFLGGLGGINSANLSLSGLSKNTQSTAGRQVSADAITALNVDGFLQLLDIFPWQLPTQAVLDLVMQLGLVDDIVAEVRAAVGDFAANLVAFYFEILPLAEQQFADATTVYNAAFVAKTAAAAALVQAQDALAVCEVLPVVCTSELAAVDAATTALADATTAFNTAELNYNTTGGVLEYLLSFADNFYDILLSFVLSAPLVTIEGVQAGATALAADTIANSSANVFGTINAISVGTLPPVGPVDGTAALDALTAAAGTINGQLDDVLTILAPSLAGAVHLDLFQRSTNVFNENGYVKSLADITALVLTITPPDLCTMYGQLPKGELFSNVVNVTVSGSQLQQNLSALSPAAASADLSQLSFSGLKPSVIEIPKPGDVLDVLDGLGSSVANCDIQAIPERLGLRPAAAPEGFFTALNTPLTLKIASVSSAANFKVAATPATPATPETPALPRTGMNETLLLVIGGLMAAVALGLRRASAPVKVRASRIKQ